MGYTTELYGKIKIHPKMKAEHADYINQFCQTRRVKRNAELTALRPDPHREIVGLPVGTDGGYFTGAIGFGGQENAKDIIDHNVPPAGQPGLWCKWMITTKSENKELYDAVLEWNGHEKFYDYIEWLEYLILHFFEPWGYSLNGTTKWQGQREEDTGFILVEDNTVVVEKGK